MEDHLLQVYVKYIDHGLIDTDGMSLQELFDHRFEFIRLENKCLAMIEALDREEKNRC